MRKPARLTLLAGLLLALGGLAPPASADVSAIAFGRSATRVDGRVTEAGVWAMPATGGVPTMLAKGGFPQFSPDGRRLAYSTYVDDVAVIETSDIDGSNRTTAIADSTEYGEFFYGGFGFGPGNQVAVGLIDPSDGRAGELVVAEGDGANRRVVYSAPEGQEVIRPSFSPDGSEIVFQLLGSGSGEIWVIGTDGSNLRRLTEGGAAPTYSPDGGTIAFFDCPRQGDSFQCDVFAMNRDGSGVRNLTSTPDQDELYPAFSPDGAKLAIEIGERVVDDVFIPSRIETMNADGSARADLTGAIPGAEYGPTWANVAALPKPPADPCKKAKRKVQKAKKRFKKLRRKDAPKRALGKAKERIKEAKQEAKSICKKGDFG
jgi:hypothetical protein